MRTEAITMAITMKRHAPLTLAAVLAAALAGPALTGQGSEPKVKVLATAVDASIAEHGVLIGRASVGGMLIQMELEHANGMWMLKGNPAKWMEMGVAPGQLYHVEVKPIDPKSNTRIPYAEVMFMAINTDTGEKVKVCCIPCGAEAASIMHSTVGWPETGPTRQRSP
jgi:hypothetical protein